jgi:hypothetical protein
MANLIGPSFYAGFLDIGFLPDLIRRLLRRLRKFARAGLRRLHRLSREDERVEERLTGELGFFETTFLTMQRKIFEDQALMHEAYLGGGLDAIRALAIAGVIDSSTARAWEQIDSGDPAEVHVGNRTLLYREQYDIIDRFYVDMHRHAPPSGRLFTYLLTLAGTPAIPGAKSYCDAFPLTLSVQVSRRARVRLRTPLAAGNLALFTNRWRLIETDTLPIYQRLIAERAAEVRKLIEWPITARAGRFRLLRRGCRVILALLTHWRVSLERAAAKIVAAGADVTIDLTAAPTREDAGFAPTGDSRIWTNLQRRPFRVSIALPGERRFLTEAVLVVLFSPEPGGNPSRLTVKLPPTDLEGARRTLAQLAADSQLAGAEITAWAARAAATTTASHTYSTRVFTAQSADSVTVELQVEHHVEQDTYIVDTLFSW